MAGEQWPPPTAELQAMASAMARNRERRAAKETECVSGFFDGRTMLGG